MKNEYTVKTRTKKFDELGILIVMIALFVFLAIATPYFLKVENIQNLLLQSVFVMLVGFGMTFVLTIGGIDLSVGSIPVSYTHLDVYKRQRLPCVTRLRYAGKQDLA